MFGALKFLMNWSMIGPPLSETCLLKKSGEVARNISGMYDALIVHKRIKATIIFVII